MNTHEFDKAYKNGYNLDKIIPANIDRKVVDEWTEGQRVISFKVNDGNFLLTCIDDSEGDDQMLYSFMRFFSLGGNTQCSVDFQASTQKEMIRKITSLLEEKHTF
jgi:hypothetical protein